MLRFHRLSVLSTRFVLDGLADGQEEEAAVVEGRVTAQALRTESLSLVRLARQVHEGDIVLPKFQRGFVWGRGQVLELLDSIAHDYPIGSFLLWQTREKLASDSTIAGLAISPPRPDYPHNYLLDGQQRLSTICGAYFWQPEDPKSMWNIVYDLETGQFSHAVTLEDPPPHQVPVRLLADAAGYFRRTGPLPEPLPERADALYRQFQDYAIAVVTITQMGADEVAKVFERVNSTATRLTIADLIRAATWTTDFDMSELLEELAEELRPKGFGDVDQVTLLRSVAAAAGHGFDKPDIDALRKHDADALRELIQGVAEGTRRAVDTLSTHLDVPGLVALPHENQLAVLIDVFRRLRRPGGAQYDAILHWFWRTAFSGYFSGWSGGQMIDTRDAVMKFSDGTVDRIGPGGSLPDADVWRTSRFWRGTAFSKAHVLMLANERPVDLNTGQLIDTGRALSWANDMELHHFFPQAWLKKRGYSADRINSVANFVMLSSATNIWISDQPPSAYLAELIDMHGESVVRERCVRSLIPPAAFDAALNDDYGAFLAARAGALHARARELAGEPAV
jgi:hypothetical protein